MVIHRSTRILAILIAIAMIAGFFLFPRSAESYPATPDIVAITVRLQQINRERFPGMPLTISVDDDDVVVSWNG
jgi:hypothetical protein